MWNPFVSLKYLATKLNLSESMIKWRRKDPADLKLEERLGEGLTSQVYRGIRTHSEYGIEQTVAVKVFKSRKAVQALKNEMHILSRVDSHHCVRLLGWADFRRGPAIILEHLEGLSLYELVSYEKLSAGLIGEIIAQLQRGLADLHSHNIVHGDLSAKNIFITRKGVIKILDFGFSAIHSGTLSHGTPQFLAPEVWRGQSLTPQSDLFSAGLIKEYLSAGEVHSHRSRAGWKQQTLSAVGKNALLAREPQERKFLEIEAKDEMRQELAAVVVRAMTKKQATSMTTRWIGHAIATKTEPRWVFSAFFISFLFFHQLQPASQPITSEFYSLDVRSHGWSQLRLLRKGYLDTDQNAPAIYAPHLYERVPSGEYELHWISEGRSGIILVQLNKSRRILIK